MGLTGEEQCQGGFWGIGAGDDPAWIGSCLRGEVSGKTRPDDDDDVEQAEHGATLWAMGVAGDGATLWGNGGDKGCCDDMRQRC